MTYSSIIQKLPADLQPAMHELVEAMHQDWEDKRWARLDEQIGELAKAQQRTEQRLSELAEAQQRTEQRVSELAEAQQRTEQRLSELAEAQQRTEQRLSELAEAQQRTEQRVSELAEAQRALAEAQQRTEQRVSELTEAQQRSEERIGRLDELVAKLARVQDGLLEYQRRIDDRLGKHTGILLEWQYQARPYAYLGRVLRRARTVPWDEIVSDLEQRLTDDELDDVALLDVLARGRPKQEIGKDQVWVAIEVSAVVDRHDVERAVRRAELLRRAGYLVVPAVAGEDATAGGQESAQQQAVALIRNGAIEFWDTALQKALSG